VKRRFGNAEKGFVVIAKSRDFHLGVSDKPIECLIYIGRFNLELKEDDLLWHFSLYHFLWG
jgi:hypothetical protein